MSFMCAQSFPRPITAPTEGGSMGQRAAFLNDVLWPTLATIKIYFFPLPAAHLLSQVYWQRPSLPANLQNPQDFLDPLYETLQEKVDPITLVKTIVEQRLQPLVGLNLVFTTDINESDIRIIFGPQYGCSSYVGNTKYVPLALRNEPTMWFGWLDVATVIHEFCHALGMIHEHQNPEENPIQFNREAVYCYYRTTQGWDTAKIDQNIINTYKLEQTNGSNFDPQSIMVYPFQATLKCTLCEPMNDNNSSTCGVRYLQTTTNGFSVDPVYKLSPTDIKWLGIMYPKNGQRDLTLIRTLGNEVTPDDKKKTFVIDREIAKEVATGVTTFLQKNGKWVTLAGVVLFILFFVLR